MGDLKTIFEDAELKMVGIIDHFEKEVSKMRIGSVNVQFLKEIEVEAYGSKMPINQVATISVPNAISAIITPWDKANVQIIANAIAEAFNYEINPTVRDNAVYVNFPPLTQEKRKEYLKILKTQVEEYRQRLRDIRQDAKNAIERLKKDGEITEDEYYKSIEDLDELTRNYTDQIQSIFDKKAKALLN